MSKAGGNATQDQLVRFAERIESLIHDRQLISDDIKDVKAEAKSDGYDVRTLMKVIALRKLTPAVRQEQASLMETYCAAFGIDIHE